MSLPTVTLPYGFLFIYGTGMEQGVYGNQATNTVFKFGRVYGVGLDMSTSIIGNSICFDSRRTVCALAWDSYPYTIVEADLIIATEIVPIPEP